jgi:hypothetical protein
MRTLLLFLFMGCLAVLMCCVKAAHWIISLWPEKSSGQAQWFGFKMPPFASSSDVGKYPQHRQRLVTSNTCRRVG